MFGNKSSTVRKRWPGIVLAPALAGTMLLFGSPATALDQVEYDDHVSVVAYEAAEYSVPEVTQSEEPETFVASEPELATASESEPNDDEASEDLSEPESNHEEQAPSEDEATEADEDESPLLAPFGDEEGIVLFADEEPASLTAVTFSPNPIGVNGTSTLTYTVDREFGNAAVPFEFTGIADDPFLQFVPGTLGGTCQVTASDDTSTGQFDWSGALPASQSSCTVTITATGTEPGVWWSGIDPLFGINQYVNGAYLTVRDYSVSVQVDPAGGGTASATPVGADAGEPVQLSATPAAGYQFVGWQVLSGNVTLSDPADPDATFDMPNANVQLRAVFAPFPTLTKQFDPSTINQGGSSTLTFTVNRSDASYDQSFYFIDQLPAGLTATPPVVANTCHGAAGIDPDTGVDLMGQGTLQPGETSCTISFSVTGNAVGSFTNQVLDSDVFQLVNNATATLVVNPPAPVYNVTAEPSSTVGGTASATPSTAVAGQTIQLSATPAAGYHFVRWEVVSGTAPSLDVNNPNATFTMPNGNVELLAVFAPDDVPPTPTGQLALEKTGPATAVPGQSITWTVTASNPGQVQVDDAVVTDYLPSGVTLTDAPGCTPTTGVGPLRITCAVGALAPEASRPFAITATVDQNFVELINTASIAAPSVGPGVIDVAFATTTVGVPPVPVLAITKTGPETASAGQQITWTIVGENRGEVAADDAVITDMLPAGVTLVAAPGCTPATGVGPLEVTCPIGELAGGASQTFQITAIINTGFTGRLENQATLTSASTDVTALASWFTNVSVPVPPTPFPPRPPHPRPPHTWNRPKPIAPTQPGLPSKPGQAGAHHPVTGPWLGLVPLALGTTAAGLVAVKRKQR